MASTEAALCTRAGCGKRVDEGECRYHPDAPVFHERTRKWPCCDVSSTSFDEFLAVPGCTTGAHVAPSFDPNSNDAVSARIKGPRFYVHYDAADADGAPDLTAVFDWDPARSIRRLREDFVVRYNRQNGPAALLKLATVRIAASDAASAPALPLDALLGDVAAPGADLYCAVVAAEDAVPPSAPPPTSEQAAAAAGSDADADDEDTGPRDPHALRTCLNFTCGGTYTDADNGPTACSFHLAPPFFHDASQGYECCARVMSFDEFEAIRPCQVGPHSDVPQSKRAPIKRTKKGENAMEFTQDATTVTLTFGLPGAAKDGVDVDVEEEELFIVISRPGTKDFSYTVDPLFAAVKPGVAAVVVDADTVAITLTKAKANKTWDALAQS